MNLFSSCLVFAVVTFGLSGTALAAADGMLAERHAARNVMCTACHQTMPPKNDVKSAACETCHGNLAEVAKKTDQADINPHDSHVEEAGCLECHQGHKRPRLLCDQCHEFTQIRVP